MARRRDWRGEINGGTTALFNHRRKSPLSLTVTSPLGKGSVDSPTLEKGAVD